MKASTVIGARHARHRAQECRQFLSGIEAAAPADLDVHLILDNYATHKNDRERAKHERVERTL